MERKLSSKPQQGWAPSPIEVISLAELHINQPTRLQKYRIITIAPTRDSTESLADRAVFSHVERQLHTGRISGTFEGFFRQLNSPLKGMAQYFLVPMNPFLSEKTFNQKNSTSITCIDFGFSKNPTESARVLWYPLSFTYVTVARVWFKITWELSI